MQILPLFISIYQIVLVSLIVFLPCWLIIPNRKFKKLNEDAILDIIKNLKNKERISFRFKKIKVSIKRKGNELIVEPYTTKFTEFIHRLISFFTVAVVLIFILSIIAYVLDSFNVGDGYVGNDQYRSVSWQGVLVNSLDKFIYIYLIIFFFLGRLVRKKIIHQLIVMRNKDIWSEFNFIYQNRELLNDK